MNIPRQGLVAFAALLASGCSDVCGNKIISETVSPGSDRKAVVFERDCGATTAFSTQISIIDARDGLSGSGNTFVIDRGQLIDGWNGPWASVTWVGPRTLEIRYEATARTFEKDSAVDGVAVRYIPVRMANR